MFVDIGFRDAPMLDSVNKISEEYFRTALSTGSYRAWLAEDANGSVVAGGGIVIADWPGFPGERHARRAWILNMYTEPVARRQGLARRLLDTMVEWCRKQGFGSVSLHASEFGRPLYESLGFAPTNEMRLTLR
jgi:GNAT superfamily N-acetyltransferase